MVTLDVIRQIHDFIWGMPLICLIIIVGVWLTIKLKGLQVTKLKKAFSFMLKEEEGQKGQGDAGQPEGVRPRVHHRRHLWHHHRHQG